MTLNFGLYKHAQMMVCQLLLVWFNFCFNHCQLFVNQGATSSFFKKYLNTKERDAKKVRPDEFKRNLA